MFCKNCGHKINDGASFCSKCGQKTDAKIREDKIKQINKESDDHFKKELYVFIPVCIIVIIIAIFLGVK
ncbi:MAG: zinc-ribbon domain-containing protein [Clostridium sp.]